MSTDWKARAEALEHECKLSMKTIAAERVRAEAAEARMKELESQEPVAIVLKKVIDTFDIEGTEIVEAVLFPKGTLRPENECPIYSAPVPRLTVTDEMVERAAKIYAKRVLGSDEGWRRAKVDVRRAYTALARAALTAALENRHD